MRQVGLLGLGIGGGGGGRGLDHLVIEVARWRECEEWEGGRGIDGGIVGGSGVWHGLSASVCAVGT